MSVSETYAIALVQAGMQANHFARAIDRAGNITNFIENCAGESFLFFLKQKGHFLLNFCAWYKKRYNLE